MTMAHSNDILQREIIWTDVDYSDLSGFKVRPVLVISNNNYNKNHQDIICCAITSSLLYLDCCINITNDDIESGKQLTKESRVRYDWLLRVDKNLIGDRHSKIKIKKMEEIVIMIHNLITII